MSDPSICSRCAKLHPTCCRISPGREDFCFPLSPAERRLLEQHHVLENGLHFAQSDNTPAFLCQLRRLFPRDLSAIKRLFPLHQKHDRLALTIDGACVFLGPSGCSVPVQDRPLYCRIYPFWFVGKRLTGFASPSCLAVQVATSPEGWLSLFNTDQSALWETYLLLRKSWGLDHD